MADAPSPRGVTSGAYTALSIILAASGISYIALPQVCWSNFAVCTEGTAYSRPGCLRTCLIGFC